MCFGVPRLIIILLQEQSKIDSGSTEGRPDQVGRAHPLLLPEIHGVVDQHEHLPPVPRAHTDAIEVGAVHVPDASTVEALTPKQVRSDDKWDVW